MGRVRILWGSGRGPTALASYDAALAAANVHDYNLVHISSVLPTETTVDLVGLAPDLGPVGEMLTLVEARETTRITTPENVDTSPGAGTDKTGQGPTDGEAERATACAGLGWTQAENGRGIVYEATGSEPDAVRRRIDRGLRAGSALRDFAPIRSDRAVLATDGTTTWVQKGAETLDPTPERAHDPVTARDPDGEDGENEGGEPEYATAVVLAAYGESDPIL